MLKELLSEFALFINPSYQPNSFRPYFSLILTIVIATFVVYGIQTVITNIYTFANKPSLSKTKVQSGLCNGAGTDQLYICKGVENNERISYAAIPLASLEQDLQRLMN